MNSCRVSYIHTCVYVHIYMTHTSLCVYVHTWHILLSMSMHIHSICSSLCLCMLHYTWALFIYILQQQLLCAMIMYTFDNYRFLCLCTSMANTALNISLHIWDLKTPMYMYLCTWTHSSNRRYACPVNFEKSEIVNLYDYFSGKVVQPAGILPACRSAMLLWSGAMGAWGVGGLNLWDLKHIPGQLVTIIFIGWLRLLCPADLLNLLYY